MFFDDELQAPRYRSKVVAYYHLVWATKGRTDRILPEWERQVYRCMVSAARKNRCIVLAIGGLEDHVHVVIRAPGKLGPAQIAHLLKGPASALMNDLRTEFSERFRWQEGYACFTLCSPILPSVTAYVRSQKQRHQAGKLWAQWEETQELDLNASEDELGDETDLLAHLGLLD